MSSFALDVLHAAWEDVWSNDAEDGPFSAFVKRYAANLDDKLKKLVDELAQQTYCAQPLTPIVITDSGGQQRELRILAVQDRVVARAVVDLTRDTADKFMG